MIFNLNMFLYDCQGGVDGSDGSQGLGGEGKPAGKHGLLFLFDHLVHDFLRPIC